MMVTSMQKLIPANMDLNCFACSHGLTVSVTHPSGSLEWLDFICVSVPEDSPSATPRLNHSAVRVEIVSKIVLRESSAEGLETIEIVMHTIIIQLN